MKELTIFLIITLVIYNCLCGMDSSYFLYDCSMFEEIKQAICGSLKSEDKNKKCSLVNNECISTYEECEEYEGNNQNICESIIPEDFPQYKCVLENSKCIQKERVCSDFKFGSEPNYNCNLLKAIDSSKKKCFFSNNKCEETYKHCEDYVQNVDKNICESILPLDEYNYDYDIFSKCVYENGKCVKRERYCEEFNFNIIDEEICYYLPLYDESKRCALVNNQCIEQYINCEDYKGNNKEICEFIEPFDEENDSVYFLYKCVFEGGSCKKKKKTSCSDYKSGTDEYKCSYIELEDSKKACILYNKNCIETFKNCEDYTGNDVKQCESIIPLISDYGKDGKIYVDINYEKKCVYENEKCITKDKYCSEYQATAENSKVEEICEELKLNDPNKICIFYENKCIETYGRCEDYVDNVEKQKCEEIIPADYISTECVYDSQNNKCITKRKLCSSYNIDIYKYQCQSVGDYTNMICSYSNGKCLGEKNTNPIPKDTDTGNDNNDNNLGKINFPNLFLIFGSLLLF